MSDKNKLSSFFNSFKPKLYKNRNDDKIQYSYWLLKFVGYGKTFQGNYKISMRNGNGEIQLYKSKTKPKYKNLYLYFISSIPLWIVVNIILILLKTLLHTFLILVQFFYNKLYVRWEMNETEENVSGIISLIFYAVGIASTVFYISKHL